MTDDIKQALARPGAGPAKPAPHPPERRRLAAKALGRAAMLRQAGKPDESIHPLRQAIEAVPDDPRAHFDLGLTLLGCGRPSEAVASLQLAASLKPDYADAYYQLGVALQTIGEDLPAIAAFRRAAEINPKLTDAHNRMGCLLQAAGRFTQATEAFRKGAAAGGRTTVGQICEARLLAAEEKFPEAIEVLQCALARTPGDLELTMLLGHVLIFAGDLVGAVGQYAKAVSLGAGHTALAQIKRITEADRPLIEQMERLTEQAGSLDLQRMEVHFALGKCYDDLRQYETAITHFDAANRIRRRYATFDRGNLEKLVDLTIEQCSPAFFRERAGVGNPDETPVFVLGMPRSGTTLVETILSSHPMVAGAGELTFWMHNAGLLDRRGPAGVGVETAQRLAAGFLAELRSHSADAERIIDKMPFTFLWLGLVHPVLPRARIIHCRRNPVDTCLSIYFTSFQIRRGFFSDRSDLAFYYRHYQRLMQHWRRVLPPDQFTEIDYETLVADRESETRRLIAFCGLEWDDACLSPEENARVIKTASMWQARQPVYRSSLERWRRYEPWLGPLRDLLAPPSPAQ